MKIRVLMYASVIGVLGGALTITPAIVSAQPGDTIPESQNDAVRLQPIEVEDSAEGAAMDGPVLGYRATRSATATKTAVPILQTPASVQVVSREVLDDQQVLNVDQAVKNVSGVYENIGPDGNTADNFLIRGFQVGYYGGTYRDGVKDFSRSPAEVAGLERIEVLKGPAAILYGRIEPGGLINRVSKKPLAESFTEVQQQLGTDSFFRTTLDSTGPLAGESVLYRVNITRDDSDGFKKFTHNDRLYIAPQITWLAGDSTEINVGIEYLDDERSWALTYGTIGDENGPVDIPIETNLHEKDDIYTQESMTYRFRLTHAFSQDWQLRSQVSYHDRESFARGSGLSMADADGDYSRDYWGWNDEQVESKAANLELLGKAVTGTVTHTLLIGTDYFEEDHNSGGWSYGGTPVLSNIHNPVYVDNPPYRQDRAVDDWWFYNYHTGVYIQDQMALWEDRLHIMLGARYDNAEYEVNYEGAGGAPENSNTTYRAGVLYQATDRSSYYVSFVEGFGAPQFDWSTGEQYEPQTSDQVEVGAKYEFGADASLTLAYFELVKDNLVRADPLDPTVTILAGEARSRGFEVDLSGSLTDNLNAILAYAYTDTEWTNSAFYQGESFVGVPEHGLSVWMTYREADSPWKFGLGATYRSDRRGLYAGDYPDLAPYTLDAYTLIDAMASYDFILAGLDASAQVNVSNLSDERYYPTTYHGSIDRIELGVPRSVIASLNVHF
ncbi:MAG TPA: TonB-dependent siderophore receptor [Gammaproteobacteria bacterium]